MHEKMRIQNRQRIKAETQRRKDQFVDEEVVEELLVQLESGDFSVDRKWLLKEAIKHYMTCKPHEKKAALDLVGKFSGFEKESNVDERAVMASLIESMRNGKPETAGTNS
jgi:hypothetical protein